MDVRQTVAGIKRAIAALEESGPVFGSDNVALLEAMPPQQRKAFAKARLQLAKLATAGRSTPEIVRTVLEYVLRPKG